jgi:hypothetical protein
MDACRYDENAASLVRTAPSSPPGPSAFLSLEDSSGSERRSRRRPNRGSLFENRLQTRVLRSAKRRGWDSNPRGRSRGLAVFKVATETAYSRAAFTVYGFARKYSSPLARSPRLGASRVRRRWDRSADQGILNPTDNVQAFLATTPHLTFYAAKTLSPTTLGTTDLLFFSSPVPPAPGIRNAIGSSLGAAMLSSMHSAEDLSRHVAQPWEKQPGEGAKAFHAFCIYRDFGASRSLPKAAP